MAAGTERPLGRSGLVALVGLLALGTGLATGNPLTFALFLAYGVVGGLLISRRPANVIGWITLAIAFRLHRDHGSHQLRRRCAGSRDGVHARVRFRLDRRLGRQRQLLSYLALAILFPSGHLPRGRWRWPAATVIAAGAALAAISAIAPTITYLLDGGVATAIVPNRLAVLPWLPIWSLIPTSGSLTLPILALLAVAVGALVRSLSAGDRHRSASASLARLGPGLLRRRRGPRARRPRHVRRPGRCRDCLAARDGRASDRPAGNGDRGHAVPTLRDRPDHQPDGLLCHPDRDPRGRLRGGGPRSAGRARADHRRPDAPDRRFDARRRGPLPAAASPRSGRGRPAVRPGKGRQRAGRCCALRTTSR